MRKYTIPKITYVLLALILSCLSIGYTYAYFSARHTANANVTLGKISILWKDLETDGYISSLFGEDVSAISISTDGGIKRGEYTPIKAILPQEGANGEPQFANLQLGMSNDFNATVGAYCRIQIVAQYTPQGSSTAIDCEDGWVQLGINSKLITENGWFEDNGYYYCGRVDTSDSEGNITKATLTEVSSGTAELVANQIYLSPDASAELLGSNLSITLILDGVQTTNGAYGQVWDVNW